MAEQGVNEGRRRFLTLTTAVVGGVGGIAAAIPFIAAWQPSARAVAAGAPTEVDITTLEPGAQLLAKWRGRPVFIVRRDEASLAGLAQQNDRLKDPDSSQIDQQPEYAKNEHRSIRPDVLVLLGVCTHLGCSPKFRPEVKAEPFDAEWKGGFFCPCHNSRFDMAGRVFEGSPAPVNLQVPPHRFDGDNRLIIGVDQETA